MKKNTNQFNVSHVDRMNYGGAKFYRFALFPLMLFMLLLLPARMVAQTTTEDPRCALFNGLDGITDVTITDNGSYSWQMLDLKADGMKNLGFTIPDGSKGLMSSNYHVDGSTSETVIKFKVSKPILLTSQVLVSSKKSWDIFSIYVDNKLNLQISDKKQTEYKVLLSVGEHSLTLHYKKYSDYSLYADRAFLYNLKTSTTIDDYVADYESSKKTMTFKSIKSDNLGALNLNRIAMVNNDQTVSNMCSLLNIGKSAIKNIVFDKSINTYTPTSLNSFFGDLDELQTITDLKYLNTANVTDMSYMFYSCQELSSLDLTNFNTANVTDMGNMFEGCSALTSLDLTNFNTANVENMSSMFYDCSALKSLDLTNFNTANVTYMSNMFYNCQNLSKLDVSNFNTEKLLTMCSMFQKCKNLTSLDLSNFNTKSVTEMAQMFSDCSTLQNIYVSENFVTDRVYVDYHMFYGCTNLKDYSDSKVDHTYANCESGYFTLIENYAVFDQTTGTLTFGRGTNKPAGAYDLNEGEGQPAWINQSDNIKKVVFDTSFAMARPTSCYWWFAGCKNLTEIEGVENLNTRNVTSMRNMFDACSNLESLDLSNFDTQNVIYMNYMFYGCSKLTSLDLSKFNNQKVTGMISMFEGCSGLKSLNLSKFNTQSVTDMSNMFYGCSGLTSLDLSNFNTQNVEYMGSMFKGCTGLTSLNLSMFNTQNVTNMGWMFMGCSSLESLNLSNFDTQNVKHMSDMFSGCSALTSLDLSMFNTQNVEYMNCMFMGCSGLTSLDLSKFDTQKLQGMSGMFSGCSGLTSLDLSKFDTQNVFDMMSVFENCSGLTSLDLSNFNTQNVEFMLSMFKGCSGLTSLDLSNFDTKKVERMSDMFSGCSSLTTIYASDKFVITEHSYGIAMFSGCTLLKGVIAYGEDKTNHKYANYKTGYFTKLVGKNGSDKIGAVGEVLTAERLALADDKEFEAYEPFAAKAASYNRVIPEGSTWGTLCLPFAIGQSQETGCKFYRLTGIDNDCITLESYEEGAEIPAGTPVLFKMNKDEQTLSISVQNAGIVKEPVAGTNINVNLVGSFTKIGGKDNQGLDKNDYIIGKDKFWRVSDLDGGNGVGIKPMRAYIHPATASQARAAMLSIGKGDGTTAIDNLNAISNDANAEYYDANGRRTNGLQKGLNIVKRGSKTYKIMVK